MHRAEPAAERGLPRAMGIASYRMVRLIKAAPLDTWRVSACGLFRDCQSIQTGRWCISPVKFRHHAKFGQHASGVRDSTHRAFGTARGVRDSTHRRSGQHEAFGIFGLIWIGPAGRRGSAPLPRLVGSTLVKGSLGRGSAPRLISPGLRQRRAFVAPLCPRMRVKRVVPPGAGTMTRHPKTALHARVAIASAGALCIPGWPVL
jgi:hypothetical protein